ncbi:hypothetical protein ACX80I_17015 [Arthrobacter sp. MDT3-44]
MTKPGKRKAPWREDVLAQVARLRTIATSLRADPPMPSAPGDMRRSALIDGINGHVQEAEEAAKAGRRNDPAAMARAYSAIDSAEEQLLRIAPPSYVQGWIPEILSDVRKYLAPADPRRAWIEKALTASPAPVNIDDSVRESVIAASAAAHSRARQAYGQARSFYRALMWAVVLITIMAAALAVLGAYFPDKLSVCFNPQGESQGAPAKIVCATHESIFPTSDDPPQADIDKTREETITRADVALIELMGLLAAAVSGAASLRKVQGTFSPYSVPALLGLMKLPLGALTAYLGLILMRGGFVPGLSALDTAPQILAWAAIFGASQQLFTGVVDRQAKVVLDKIGGKEHKAET